MSAVDEAAWAQFVDLFEGDMAAVKEIVQIFVSESAQLRDKLLAAIDAGDPDGVSRAAHSLKSTSNQLGVRNLGAMSADLEDAGRRGDLAQIVSLRGRFEELVDTARTGLIQRVA